MTLSKTSNILVVEDDEGHATLIQINLRDAGLNNPIEHISDGRTALDYVYQNQAKQRPEALLILLDLNLPEIDGYSVLEQLKSDVKTRKIPVIVLTSTDDPREIERCYELGCNIFLRKPIDYTRFVHAIKQLGLFISVVEMPSAR